jgi:4-amino-4-deoxy-L-arabinose transferase-like glycosyltransferase
MRLALGGGPAQTGCDQRLRQMFWGLWCLLLLARCALASQLPLFGDEAFYAWEARHLAWAYSDLPGFTAWTIAAGRWLVGDVEFGLRAVSLLLGAVLPLQLLRIADAAGLAHVRWQTGLLGLLLPLLSVNGLLALPEPALLVAAALCLHALLRLQTLGSGAAGAVVAWPLLELSAGLALGAFSHYRFIAVLAAGGVAVLAVPVARALLRDPRIWLALALGLLAWLPLVWFNLEGDQAGWRFQFVERHPWQFQPRALTVPLEQAIVATPLAWALMLWLLPARLKSWQTAPGPALLAWAGAALLLELYLVGLFADRERVSFHWPLVGQLALLPLLAATLCDRAVWLRRATWISLTLGAVGAWALCIALALPSGRNVLATQVSIADNFSGAAEVAAAVEAELAALPVGTRVVADNFMLAGQLVQAGRGRWPLGVMAHPLNSKHGRALQLKLWGVDEDTWIGATDPARLLVIEETALGLRERQPWLHALCDRLPGWRARRELQINGGAKRYLLYLIDGSRNGECEFPALAYLDAPVDGARLGAQFELAGWAIQDGAGLAKVEVLLDGQAIARASSDLESPGVLWQWPRSDDPRHPRVGLHARVQVPPALHGERTLGLRLSGRDGRVRELPMARIWIAPAP